WGENETDVFLLN
nr:Chain D, Epitope peptide [Hepacivirus hominis]5NPJ_E Chain E, Epitope peptide [Hepacivirus hominis]